MKFELHNGDFNEEVGVIDDNSVDFVIADPPYGLGKDYGNNPDRLSYKDLIAWTQK